MSEADNLTSRDASSKKRHSIFSRLRKSSHDVDADSVQDGASTSTNNSRFPLLSGLRSNKVADGESAKEKRESMSERGPFRVVTDPDTGMSYTIENKDWPPGVNYKVSSRVQQMQSKDGKLGGYYEGRGAIAAGGENAGNIGPDPDWVPGLSEQEREKLKKDKKGSYGKLGFFGVAGACTNSKGSIIDKHLHQMLFVAVR